MAIKIKICNTTPKHTQDEKPIFCRRFDHYGLLHSGRARISEKPGFMVRKIDNISIINVLYTEYMRKNNLVGLSVQRYFVFLK